MFIHPAGGGVATGCSSVWSECSPRTREAVGSNPTILTPQWSIGVVAAHLVLNQTARVRLPHGLRTRPRGGPLGEVVLSTSGIHTPRTGSARGRFAAVAASTWTCGAMGAQLVYTESVGGSNPSGFTADACGNPYSARAVRPARAMRVAPLLGPGRPVVVVGDPRITSPWRSGERTWFRTRGSQVRVLPGTRTVSVTECLCGAVESAPDYESGGRGFESLQGHWHCENCFASLAEMALAPGFYPGDGGSSPSRRTCPAGHRVAEMRRPPGTGT